jgi:hypothetical protein
MQEFPSISVATHAVEPLSMRAEVEERTDASVPITSPTVKNVHSADDANVLNDAAQLNSHVKKVENKLLAAEEAASPRSIASPRPESTVVPVPSPDAASSPVPSSADANESHEPRHVFKARLFLMLHSQTRALG